MSGLFIGQWAYYHRHVTLGRGNRVIRTTILVLGVVILLTVVIIVGARRDSAPGGASSPEDTSESSPGQPVDRGDATQPEDASPLAESDLEPVGAPLEGPRSARMERWQPVVSDDTGISGVPARSTIVDAPVRVVATDTSQGFDAVAVQVGRRRWDELATGITAEVPAIVWEPVERALRSTGELRWIHAVADSPQPEYVLRFDSHRLLLRLYGNEASIDDVEVELLTTP